MAKLMAKWKKAVGGGGSSSKPNKQSLLDNDFLDYEEFYYKNKQTPKQMAQLNSIVVYDDNSNYVESEKTVQYHSLKFQSAQFKRPQNGGGENKTGGLKDTTNIKNSNSTTFAKGLKRIFTPRTEKTVIQKENVVKKKEEKKTKYSQLYSPVQNQEINENNLKNNQIQETQNMVTPTNTNDLHYYEIPDSIEDEPLLQKTKRSENTVLQSAESKNNLFNKSDNDRQESSTATQPKSPDMALSREPSTFASQSDAYHWYLGMISDKMMSCVEKDANIVDDEKLKRYNIITAHLLYARNFFELKIKNSLSLRSKLASIHPCLITLACLLDSDAVRIVESHSCSCDTYVYMFQTRLKFCAWKAKLFVILKKPKHSSMERLNFIEDLTSLQKLLHDN